MITLYRRVYLFFYENYISYSAVSIILSTMIGSIAIMLTLMNGDDFFQIIQIFLSVMICSSVNTSVLTVQHPKLVLNLFIASLIINTIIISINLDI